MQKCITKVKHCHSLQPKGILEYWYYQSISFKSAWANMFKPTSKLDLSLCEKNSRSKTIWTYLKLNQFLQVSTVNKKLYNKTYSTCFFYYYYFISKCVLQQTAMLKCLFVHIKAPSSDTKPTKAPMVLARTPRPLPMPRPDRKRLVDQRNKMFFAMFSTIVEI